MFTNRPPIQQMNFADPLPHNPRADSHGTDLPLLFPDRALWGTAPLLQGVSCEDAWSATAARCGGCGPTSPARARPRRCRGWSW